MRGLRCRDRGQGHRRRNRRGAQTPRGRRQPRGLDRAPTQKANGPTAVCRRSGSDPVTLEGFRSRSTETDTEGSRSTETDTEESDSSEPDTGEPAVGLLVSEQCQELIREFYGYKADHVGGPNADDHCLDALRYAVMGTMV